MKFGAAMQIAKRLPSATVKEIKNKHWVVVIIRGDGHAISIDYDGVEDFPTFEALHTKTLNKIVNKISFIVRSPKKKRLNKLI